MKLAWLTDIHLNFLDIDKRMGFYKNITSTSCDAVLISGDIAEAPTLAEVLKEIADIINKPIYFVLGNHDYYRGGVDDVKQEMIALTKTENLLHWLPTSTYQMLADNVVLLGQDGWADGRYGDYANSRVALNDSRLIADLYQQRLLSQQHLLEKMQQLADADAQQLQKDLQHAITTCQPEKFIVVTHVPPFKETCLYRGKISGDDFLPFFGSKATGDVLTEVAKQNPEIQFLVLCGHTHDKADYQPLDNLRVKAGQAEYYSPVVQEVIEC